MSARRSIELAGWTSRADGTRLRHQVAGARPARVLLLLPGQANSHRWWRRLRGRYAADWLTVTFDYRGTGQTRLGPDDDLRWSTASFSDDAVAVLDAIGADRADVYATSMGGRVAQELALRHPERVRRMVLACTSPGGAEAHERDTVVRRALADPDPARRRASTIDLFYTPAGVTAFGGLDQVPDDLLGDRSMTPEAARAHLRVSAGHDAHDRLPAIGAPTLVLHGSDDRMVPTRNAHTLAARIPGADLRLFDGGRHGFFDELEGDVGPVVAEFLHG